MTPSPAPLPKPVGATDPLPHFYVLRHISVVLQEPNAGTGGSMIRGRQRGDGSGRWSARPRLIARLASADRFLTWHDPRPCTPSSEIVPLNPNRRDGSGGSDDHARCDYLKLDTPVKQDRPVDVHVERLSDR